MFFAAVALLATSVLATTSTYTCSRNYTVVAGDTCDGISRSVSVSTYQLATLNPVIDDACSNLEIGENLCLGLTDGSDCETTYTVAGGDSCDAITSQFSINSTYLYLNNPQIDGACDNIYVGEVLCVGNKVYQLPAAFTADNGNAPAPLIGSPVASISTAATSTTAAAANVAGAPTPGVTLVSVTTVTTSSATTSSASSTSTSSSAAPTTTATDDGDDDCEDDGDDS